MKKVKLAVLMFAFLLVKSTLADSCTCVCIATYDTIQVTASADTFILGTMDSGTIRLKSRVSSAGNVIVLGFDHNCSQVNSVLPFLASNLPDSAGFQIFKWYWVASGGLVPGAYRIVWQSLTGTGYIIGRGIWNVIVKAPPVRVIAAVTHNHLLAATGRKICNLQGRFVNDANLRNGLYVSDRKLLLVK